MKRKLFLLGVTVALIVSCAIGIVACDDSTTDEQKNLTHFEAVEATCTENGNTEYWYCPTCGKYYSDANATAEISQSDTVLPAKGHKFSEDWSYDDTYHWHAATCGHTDEMSDKAEHTHIDGICSICGAPEPSIGLEYLLNNDGTGYYVNGIGTCTDTDIVIPSTYNGLPVISVGENAFFSCISLDSITIPYGITSIGRNAFSSCTSLESITLPDSITSIGKFVFSYSALKNIIIPDSVKEIKDYAFAYCISLESIIIPNSVKSIGGYSFTYCTSLKSISIPISVTYIDEYAFNNCTSLKNIAIPEKITSIMRGVFSCCSSLESITIPDSVIDISTYAFEKCSALEKVNIGRDVNSISNYAFSYCTALESINIPESVKVIGDYAFLSCTSLKSIDIGSGVKTIGKAVFSECTLLTSVKFENTNGWRISESKTETNGTSISSKNLADPALAATYFKSTYHDYYWKCS